MVSTSKVYAFKINPYYNVITNDTICLGEISFSSLSEAFIKALRMYNKNARRHISGPMFKYKGKVFGCVDVGYPSKTGRGFTQYWTLCVYEKKMMWPPITWDCKFAEQYLITIPKSKINSKDAIRWVEK